MDRFVNAVKALFGDKKNLAAVFAVLTAVCLHFGWQVDPMILTAIVLSGGVVACSISLREAFEIIFEGKKLEAETTKEQASMMLRVETLRNETAQVKMATVAAQADLAAKTQAVA